MNESHTSDNAELRLFYSDLLNLDREKRITLASLYARFTKHFRRELRDGQWHPLNHALLSSIKESHGKEFIRLGVRMPELEGLDKISKGQMCLGAYFRLIVMSRKEYEVRTHDGEEEIRLCPSSSGSSVGRPSKRIAVPLSTSETSSMTPMRYLPRYFAKCRECGVQWGELHVWGCVMEQCPYCGMPAHSCSCPALRAFERIPDDDRLRFDGYIPTHREACELGWYCTDKGERRLACDRTDPDSRPDANRIASEARWDRDAKRFVLPAQQAS